MFEKIMKNYSKWLAILLGAGFLLIFAFALYPSWILTSYQLSPGSMTGEAIIAPERIKDEAETEKAREAAVAQVKPVYEQVDLNSSGLVFELMQQIERINGDPDLSVELKAQMYKNELFPSAYLNYYQDRLFTAATVEPQRFTEAFKEDIISSLNKNKYGDIPFEVFYKIPSLRATDLKSMEQTMLELLPKFYRQSLTDANVARARAIELVNGSELTYKTQRQITVELLSYILVPNSFVNGKATDNAKLEARMAVPQIWLEKGTVIAEEGQLVNQELYDMLVQLNLVSDGNQLDRHIGLWLFCLLLVSLMFFLLKKKLNFERDYPRYIMVLSISAIVVIIMRITHEVQQFVNYEMAFVMPVAFASIIIALLQHPRTAYVMTFMYGVLAAAMFHGENQSLFDFRIGFFMFLTGIVAIYTAGKVTQRSAMFRTGLAIAATGSLTLVSFALLEGKYELTWWFLEPLAYATLNGLFTIVLVLGLMPIFESVFKVLSNIKLIELSNQQHPLLLKLMTEAPGTYHHSMMVANLAGASAESIGANSLLCRVSAYFHDVGKLERPLFFIENNRSDENPHNKLDPYVSKAMLVAHVTEGVKMLKDHKMPKVIVDITEQHHGTTLTGFFYRKVLEGLSDEEKASFDANSFRYPGPKPQTMEAVCVMIADSVEASVRSIKQPTRDLIAQKVDAIIKEKLDDKQFNDCDVTLKELESIGNVMKQVLYGTIHERIEYPDQEAKISDSDKLGK